LNFQHRFSSSGRQLIVVFSVFEARCAGTQDGLTVEVGADSRKNDSGG
jgi:hypothetical protein